MKKKKTNGRYQIATLTFETLERNSKKRCEFNQWLDKYIYNVKKKDYFKSILSITWH